MLNQNNKDRIPIAVEKLFNQDFIKLLHTFTDVSILLKKKVFEERHKHKQKLLFHCCFIIIQLLMRSFI